MMKEDAFDAYAGAYDAALNNGLSLSGESKEYFAHARIQWTVSRLAKLGCRPKHVLDYGCGTGGSSPELLAQFSAASVTGVDTSPESIAVAQQHNGSELVQFATTDTLQPSGQFDFVYCNGVFHHIEPVLRPDALAYVSRSLSSNGYFALWENNPWNPGTRMIMRRIPFDRDAKPLSAPQARRLLGAAGFEIVETDFLFLFPRALAALRPLEAKLARVPAGAQYLVLCRKRA
jgi:SAM-dependent methyltransferase